MKDPARGVHSWREDGKQAYSAATNQRRSQDMRKILIGFGVLIVVLIAAAFVVPMFIPTDTYKNEIASRVRDATGRDLVIKGKLKFTILPTLGLTVNDVTFSNAPGAASKHMASFKQLVVKIKLMPLIGGDIEIDQFELIEPVINLEIDRRGRPNWLFAKPAQSSGKPAAKGKSAQPPAAGPAGKTSAGGGVKLRDVRLIKGRVNYLDRRTGARQSIEDANLVISLTSMSSPLTLAGSLRWNKQLIAMKVRVENPQAVGSGKSSPVTLSVRSQPITLTFGGVAKGGKAAAITGKLDLDIPSIRKLAAWTGNPIKMAGAGLGPFKVTGTLSLNPSGATLSKANIRLDEITAKGSLSVLTGGKTPSIKAKLDVAKLDLNPYLASGGAAAGSGSGASGKAGGTKSAASPAPAAKGWSRAPINTAPLRLLNADLDLSAGAILYQKIKVGRSRVRIRLNGGRLQADLLKLQLYGGSGSGKIVLDARGAALKITENFQLSGLNAKPFLHDAAGYDGLSGKGSGAVSVSGSGRSQYDIVRSLNGAGKFNFRDGAIKGANFVGMVCSFNPAALMKGVGKSKETRFSRLAGTYTIRGGILSIAKYEDLQLKSPLLRLTVKGKTSLPARTLDFRIEPKIIGSCKGQGSAFAKKGVAVPLMLGGTWEKPRWKLDLAAILKMDPKDLKKNAKEIGKGIKSLIKGKGKDGEKPEKKIKRDLKKMFKGFGKKKEEE
ncbi:MAG: AsmA family protein [Alphaproteobacteria bacterium]